MGTDNSDNRTGTFCYNYLHSPEDRLDKEISQITKDLNLTPDQKNEIAQYKKEGVGELHEMKKERLNIISEIENELTRGKSDPERIKQLYHEQSIKRDEIMNNCSDSPKSLFGNNMELDATIFGSSFRSLIVGDRVLAP